MPIERATCDSAMPVRARAIALAGARRAENTRVGVKRLAELLPRADPRATGQLQFVNVVRPTRLLVHCVPSLKLWNVVPPIWLDVPLTPLLKLWKSVVPSRFVEPFNDPPLGLLKL
jgi:hypothetical protein